VSCPGTLELRTTSTSTFPSGSGLAAATAATTAAVTSTVVWKAAGSPTEPPGLAGPALNHARVPFTTSSRSAGGVSTVAEPCAASASADTAPVKLTSSRSVWISVNSWTAVEPLLIADLPSNCVPAHGVIEEIGFGACTRSTVRIPWKSTTSSLPFASRTWATLPIVTSPAGFAVIV
jgi:hypothetical protein